MLPDVRSTRANASRKRQRPLLEVKTLTSKRRQHPSSNNIHNFDPALARRTGRSVAVLERTGHTQGWLLVDPDNANDWFPAWVSFDPHVPLLLVQLGHRHRVHDGSLLTLEIDRAYAHVVMTSSNAATASSFANTAQQGLSAFRVKVRENIIVCFAATQEHVAQIWVTALRNAIAQRTNPPPQIDFEPPRWHARPATPLKDICKHFFYEYMQNPGNGSQARQDPVLTSAMRACDLAIAWDSSLQTWSIWNTVRAGLVSLQAVIRGAQERTTRCRLAADNLEATSFCSKNLEPPITMEKTLALLNLGAACGRIHATRSLEKSSVKASHRRGLVLVLCAQETARMHEALAHMRWLQRAIANIQWRLPAHGPRLIVGVAALQSLVDAQMMLGDTSLAAGLTTPIQHTRAYIMSTLLGESQSDCTWQTHDNDSVSRQFQDTQNPDKELLPRVQSAQQRLEDLYTKTTRDIAEMLVDLDAATIDAERHGDLLVDDIDRAERKMAHARADARPASLAAFAAMQRLDRAARHRLPCVVDDVRVEFANARRDRCSIEEKIASLPFEAATDLRDLFQRVKARLEKRFAEVEHLRDAMHAASAWIPLLLEFAVVEMMTPLQLFTTHVQHLVAAQEQDQVARERLSRVRAAACLVCKCAGDTCHHVQNFRVQYHAARAALEQAFVNLASAAPSLTGVDFCNLILDNLVNYLNLVREPMQMWRQETASLFTSQLADRQQIRQAFSDRAQDLRERASHLVAVEERAKNALRSAEADPRNFWWSHVLGQRVIPSFLAKERARVASLIIRDDPVPEDARGEIDNSSFASDSSSDETMSTCSCSSCEREREHVAPAENGLFEELLAERLRKSDQAEVEAAKAAAARSQQRQERRSSTFLLHAARATLFPRAQQARLQDRAAVTLQCALRTWLARREHRRLRDVMLERARIVLAALRIQRMCRRWLR
ncbi:Hypothetical Protein FCC1311_055662 [Hondaea fermentalgiana]|uniref:PH domain-containing protein n=1 Tax=Hondaea fermentalgiana TaxID=2315210 RepID=A0A2R5GNA3_9STRA|nr:Hypothetical Protein FCC1311_055662 [Hondaea fermentalgiana]|eukprot:GBG29344.1 Hypothetical Protein FCC1311_055662 [Hondaea fermentalgiana]